MKIKLNNRRSIYTLLGQIVGIILFIFALLILFKVIRLGFSNYPKNSLGYRYDSGPAQFGADFYNYVNNNAAQAAEASRSAARNGYYLIDLVNKVSGIFLTGFGATIFCLFGAISARDKMDEAPISSIPSDTSALPVLKDTPSYDESSTLTSLNDMKQQTGTTESNSNVQMYDSTTPAHTQVNEVLSNSSAEDNDEAEHLKDHENDHEFLDEENEPNQLEL